jgi:hypothetical protein
MTKNIKIWQKECIRSFRIQTGNRDPDLKLSGIVDPDPETHIVNTATENSATLRFNSKIFCFRICCAAEEVNKNDIHTYIQNRYN